MTRGVNKVILIGNVGKDPEQHESGAGMSVVTTSLATTEKWKDQSGTQQERTEWHNLVAFAKTADIMAEYVTKGTKLYVEGKIQTQTYEKDDITQYRTKIIVNNFLMLGDSGNPQGEPAPQPKAKPKKAAPKEQFVDDDIPF